MAWGGPICPKCGVLDRHTKACLRGEDQKQVDVFLAELDRLLTSPIPPELKEAAAKALEVSKRNAKLSKDDWIQLVLDSSNVD